MDETKYPREEDVVADINFGSARVVAVRITDENTDYLIEMAMSAYVGETCPFCLHVFESIDDLRVRESVFYLSDHGRTACKRCFDER